MNGNLTKKNARRCGYVPDWIWEILIVATVLPALLHGVLAVGNFPVV